MRRAARIVLVVALAFGLVVVLFEFVFPRVETFFEDPTLGS